MARINAICALEIILLVSLEDAASASTVWAKGAALGIAAEARRRLRQMGAVA